MSGPKIGWKLPGCALTMALLGILVATFLSFNPVKQSAPARLAPAASGQALKFPELTGRVVDGANIIPDDVEARLTQKLEALETQSNRQLVVATLPDLQGYEISDYGYQLGRAWGIGSKEKNDGALLIVAPNERKLRIEVGYGLEGILTDGLSSLIIQQQIVPKFKAGDMPGGIEAGTDALITQLSLPEGEARIAAGQAQTVKSPEGQGDIIPIVFFGFIFLFVFVLSRDRVFLLRLIGHIGVRVKGDDAGVSRCLRRLRR